MGEESALRSYRHLLEDELRERALKNKLYSARAFARDLGLSTPFLNQVLNGKRFLKVEKALLVADKLKWTTVKTQSFVTLLNYETAKDPLVKEKLLKQLNSKKLRRVSFQKISEEQFLKISAWYCLAILELTLVEDFKADPKWIAKRLGITQKQTEDAIENLFHFGLLVEKDGTWVKSHRDFATSNGVASKANRVFHSQILDLAQKKLENSPISNRAFSSINLIGDPEQMLKWKKKILEFRDEMMLEVEASRPKAVFQLSIQMLRLDEGENG